jgi:hypothetical protein
MSFVSLCIIFKASASFDHSTQTHPTLCSFVGLVPVKVVQGFICMAFTAETRGAMMKVMIHCVLHKGTRPELRSQG